MKELIEILQKMLADEKKELKISKEDEEKYLSINMRMMLAESREFRKKTLEKLKKIHKK